MTSQQIREFVLAGNALFTLKSLRTGKHFTFKVERVMRMTGAHHHGNPTQPCREPECRTQVPVWPPTWNVKVLSGRDNTRRDNYRFVGSIRNDHFAYATSSGTPATKGFAWCWKHLERTGERFEFAHAGRCGRCGRLLTHPESLQSGIGPECQDKMAFEAGGGVDGLLGELFGG